MGEALREKKAADPKPLTCEGLAIINPYGGIWTPKLFDTENEARKHVMDFWKDKDAVKRGYSFRPARLTIEVL